DEATRREEVTLESGCDCASLLRCGQSEVQRERGRQRRAIGHALECAPANVVEECAVGIPRGGKQCPPSCLGERGVVAGTRRVAPIAAEGEERGGGSPRVVAQAA